MKKKYNYCIVFGTKNYYDMFEGYLYKYSKANWKDVLVLNVDIDSSAAEKQRGEQICKSLGIHFVNPNKNYTSWQNIIHAADEYLQKHNLDIDWIISCQHDVVPVQSDFWEQLDACLKTINKHKDRVGMFGVTVYQYVDYYQACKLATDPDLIRRRSTGTSTGRGCIQPEMKSEGCWYKNLPTEYYTSDYFVSESPGFPFVGFNRTLCRKYIQPDDVMRFELWPDDIAHQLLKHNLFNVSFPAPLVCTDHSLKPATCQSIARNTSRIDFCPEHLRFIEKHGWRWGYRMYNDKSFDDVVSDYKNTTQQKLYQLSIHDGPKTIEDFLDE